MAGELWVDFKAVKAHVGIKDVLAHYGLLDKFKVAGDRLTGPCPIHKGTSDKSFSVSVSKNAFKCFSGKCGKSGNQIDLVAAIEGVAFRDAALLLQGWFGITPSAAAKADDPATPPPAAPAAPLPSAAPPQPAENKVLSFQLKLDPAHPYLAERGLTPATVSHFGLGGCERGSMKGRIAIPIHNERGELVAYAGRSVGKDADLPAGEGKYKLPAGFHKSLVVYNLHQLPPATKTLVLVEGFWSVFWLHQHGFPEVVSAMGSTIAPAQIELLAQRCKGVRIFFDGDDAGREGARKVALDLAPRLWVRIVTCDDGLQPDRLPEHELKRLLS